MSSRDVIRLVREDSPEETTVLRTRPSRRFDDEMLPIFFGLWVVSVVRAVVPLYRGEAFGAETSIAFLAALFLPLAMVESIGRIVRGLRARLH